MENNRLLNVRVSDGLARLFAASEAISDAELVKLADKARQNAAHYREGISPHNRSQRKSQSSSGLS
ncbi:MULTISPECIES: hypothetical protein [Serratia]|jgi:hypothetical protein|uniref:hypothetical protein n=1 Tax=Yersiniaceae TaxID=1903411 RepID=UPI001A1B7460|nr:hypothetical protein [Serratia liquefaciens]EKN4908425.1 hypothetical protein [Yersinia enterocolitica]HAT3731079.1 hypothetical protein [Serratia marcescens]HEN3244202.1 hypothetical protein [Yersinia enterocolitica]HEN3450915.1 hypothetical protein [Yersinia enterocolitica]